jgi:hypothetical protein
LFGAKAEPHLQAQFKVIVNSSLVISDNDVKTQILTAMNAFFALDNWDFGDTFYFTEMAAYITQQLSPAIVNFVIVPTATTLTFGGLFEISAEKSTSIIDEDGDIMVDSLDDPLLYGFVTEEFIKKTPHKKTEVKPDTESDKKPEESVKKVEVEEEEEEDKVVKIKIPEHKKSEEIEDSTKKLEEGIFKTDSKVVPPNLLPEETMEEATEMKKEFRKNPRNAWIANFMKNNHFKIHEVEKNGDCFIAVIRDAFKQVGKITDVSKLRALLARKKVEEYAKNNVNEKLESKSKSNSKVK